MRMRAGAWLVVALATASHGVAFAETHAIHFRVSDSDFQRYSAAQARTLGGKEGANEREARTQMAFDARLATVRVDAGPVLRLREMSTHGQTSAGARRRNFEVHLEDRAEARIQIGAVEADKLFLLSMQADEGYVSSAIGYKILALSGLAVPAFSYVELFLNDVSQGIYLAIERPVDVAREDLNGVYVARRRYFDHLEVKKYEAEETEISEAEFTDGLRETFGLGNELGGRELYTAWSRRLDIDAYMSWIGLNALLRNGDFSDEIYFYSRSAGPYYEIFPWDMDDLFKKRMHLAPLNWILSGFDANTLLFSFESQLDRKINSDAFLYRKFQENLQRQLSRNVTDEAIDRVIDSTRAEVSPYLDIPAVQANARKDWIHREGLDRDSVHKLLEARRQSLKATRRAFLARID
jgi:hypothetical protein